MSSAAWDTGGAGAVGVGCVLFRTGMSFPAHLVGGLPGVRVHAGVPVGAAGGFCGGLGDASSFPAGGPAVVSALRGDLLPRGERLPPCASRGAAGDPGGVPASPGVSALSLTERGGRFFLIFVFPGNRNIKRSLVGGGARSRNRTDDRLITSQVLYQLSYSGACVANRVNLTAVRIFCSRPSLYIPYLPAAQ